MRFFAKEKIPPAPVGRRRPASNDQGTNRAQAFSYYAQRSGTSANTGRGQDSLQASKSHAEAARQLPLLAIGGGLLLLALLVYLLSLNSDPKVVIQRQSGIGYFMQDATVYQQSAANSLAGSVLNKNKLTLNSAAVARELTENYPEIGTAHVKVPFFGHQPTIYIEPYTPSFILTTTTSNAYLLDDNGRALVSTSQIHDAGELTAPTVQDKSGIAVRVGTQALPSGTVQFIQDVLAVLAAAKVQLSSMVLPPAASELDIYISGKPYFVKFNLEGDARLQTGTFLAAKARLEKDRAVVSQYIDVRVDGRAYIR